MPTTISAEFELRQKIWLDCNKTAKKGERSIWERVGYSTRIKLMEPAIVHLPIEMIVIVASVHEKKKKMDVIDRSYNVETKKGPLRIDWCFEDKADALKAFNSDFVKSCHKELAGCNKALRTQKQNLSPLQVRELHGMIKQLERAIKKFSKKT